MGDKVSEIHWIPDGIGSINRRDQRQNNTHRVEALVHIVQVVAEEPVQVVQNIRRIYLEVNVIAGDDEAKAEVTEGQREEIVVVFLAHDVLIAQDQDTDEIAKCAEDH